MRSFVMQHHKYRSTTLLLPHDSAIIASFLVVGYVRAVSPGASKILRCGNFLGSSLWSVVSKVAFRFEKSIV
jgi:hypothetical protein